MSAQGGRQVADRYELDEPVGRGRSTVWRGHDRLLRRDVAVKEVALPHGDLDTEALRTRAIREARAAARLNVPSAVTVFDVAEEDDRLWLVMELVDAPSLAELVATRGPLDHAAAARIAMHVLDALDAAHGGGVVHRDVKPANVLVGEGSLVKLTDFGVATLRDETRVTSPGMAVGSPSYMAPEQIEAEAQPATDLWALGATLYFAVEGVAPFERDSAMATLLAIREGRHRPMTNRGPLTPLIIDLLASDPAARPDAGELRRRLADVAAGTEAATTRVAGRPERTRAAAAPAAPTTPDPIATPGPPRTGPGPAMVAVVIAALLVAGVVAWAATRSRDDGSSTATSTTTAAPATTATKPSTTAAPARTRWATYTDPAAGYAIAHPAGWKVVPAGGNRTDIRDPETGSYLRIDWTDHPRKDPVADWKQAKSFAAANPGYEEIAIEKADYRDYDAALWEFRYRPGGRVLHAADLGFVTADRGYALYFQTPDDRWDAAQPTFDRFKETFQPG
jgi:hypothetical protein